MADSRTADPVAAPEGPADVVGRSRYRHPGDVTWLVASTVILVVFFGVAAAGAGMLLGRRASVVPGLGPDTAAGRLLVGLVQLTALVALGGALGAALWTRRFRLLASLFGAGALATAGWIAIRFLFPDQPAELAANREAPAWPLGAGLPGAGGMAAAVAVLVVAGPWLSLAWRRVAWMVLVLAAVAQLVSDVVLPMELLLAGAVGAVAGALFLVAFGAPDRRIGPTEIASALTAAGLPVDSVRPAQVPSKGSRPFVATQPDGRQVFVKVLGRDQRHADLLYRGYRLARLRGVGDTRPAASLRQAVEHQALVGLVAAQAGARVPRFHRIAQAVDGSALLSMQLVTGRSLPDVPIDDITDDLLRQLWEQARRLHAARIAHRSLHAGNVMIDESGRPWILDFSFSELAATDRQLALDRAELLASTASLVSAERAVLAAADVLGDADLASAVPFLQPLALSQATRQAVGQQPELLARTRAAAAAASSAPDTELPRLQRVRPRTLLMIAAAAGAFYFLLPQLAQVGDSWHAFQSADWAWVPPIVLLSALTYLASGIALAGSVPQHIPFLPTQLTQVASSFVNRVTPANVGGMALEMRYMQKCGVSPATAVAAIGLNGATGAVLHTVLLVVFFAWSGTELTRAFHLPSGSKLLAVLAVLAAVLGALLATRWGRRKALRPVLTGIRSAGPQLRRLATDPIKMIQLVGGSLGVTLAYIAALACAVQAFGDGVSIAQIGAVYLAGSAIAAAAPTPGGLGPIEAALVAGLTGVGLATGPAVSAVLTYRLATYWLPILPGWLSWHLLQRRNYV